MKNVKILDWEAIKNAILPILSSQFITHLFPFGVHMFIIYVCDSFLPCKQVHQVESEKAGLKLNIQKTKIMASGPITSWEIGKQWKQGQALFFWAPKSLQMVIAAMKLKDAYSLEGKL